MRIIRLGAESEHTTLDPRKAWQVRHLSVSAPDSGCPADVGPGSMTGMNTAPDEPTPAGDGSAPASRPVRSLADHAIVGLATGGWVGLVRYAPGTFGAVWGLPLAWLTQRSSQSNLLFEVALIAVVFAVGVPICTAATARLGGKKDPGAIVLDEIASMPIVFLAVPLDSWTVAVAGFALHRLFDISKPPPARQLERLPDGLGIMADDVAAAVYANLALRLVVFTGVFAP
jgi:phosphatidylglycerophosphatase A